MSFGYGVSDVMTVLCLARDLRRGLHELHESTYDQVVSGEVGREQELLQQLLQQLPPSLDPDRFIRKQLLSYLEHLALLLLKVLRSLLSSVRSAGIMKRRRPKCTTMPWEIWPSLVILWGVCWMFYPPPIYQDGNQHQPPLEDEQLPYFSYGM